VVIDTVSDAADMETVVKAFNATVASAKRFILIFFFVFFFFCFWLFIYCSVMELVIFLFTYLTTNKILKKNMQTIYKTEILQKERNS
jgi:hypothetical protein